MKTAFFRYLQKTLIEAFTNHATSPERVARILATMRHRPCSAATGLAMKHWMRQRGIDRLVHFTLVDNVPAIMRYGIIPREHLELNVVRMVVQPRFPDNFRLDEMPENTCFSLTSVNYKMFYRKRQEFEPARWAVLEIDPEVLTKIHFTFAPTNAARYRDAVPGDDGAELMFMAPEVRERLGLASFEPTDPQAEALCDSIIGREYLSKVWVENDQDVRFLATRGVTASVDAGLFRARRDYGFWRDRTILDVIGEPGVREPRAGGRL